MGVRFAKVTVGSMNSSTIQSTPCLGFIQRHTVETMLGKVESIGVEQSLVGRVLDYGTILVVGTGGTQDSFKNIANPLEFRRKVQA